MATRYTVVCGKNAEAVERASIAGGPRERRDTLEEAWAIAEHLREEGYVAQIYKHIETWAETWTSKVEG